jgi:hypothetical protein
MMIRAITAITNAAATKMAISSPLESPPLEEELLAAGATVTGPVLWVPDACVLEVVGSSDGVGLVAPLAALAAATGRLRTSDTTTATITATRRSAPLSAVVGSWRKIAAI